MTFLSKGMVQISHLCVSLAILAIVSPNLFSLDVAQTKSRISVAPAVNATSQDNFDSEAKIVFDTVEEALRKTGRFQIVEWTGSVLRTSDGEAFASEAQRRSLDYVVMIRLERASNAVEWDAGVCRISVFDRSQRKVTIEVTSGPARLRGFLGTSGKAVSAVLGALAGTPIGFGVIDLDNTGEKGAYEILLDGRVVPEEQLGIVLSGSHDLVVRQKRLLGDLILVSSNVQVKESKTTKVAISVPFLTAEEQSKVTGMANAVEQLWNDPNAGAKMDKALADQESFFDDIRCSPRLAILRKAAEVKTSEWPVQQKKLRETVHWTSKQPVVSLEQQSRTLTDQKPQMEEQRKRVGWMGLGGWVVAGVGAGLIGYSWYSANSALSSYNSSTTQSDWDSARGRMNTANLFLSIGSGVGITGLAVGISSLFLEPDISKVDRQIKNIDQKLTLQGAQK